MAQKKYKINSNSVQQTQTKIENNISSINIFIYIVINIYNIV